MYNGHADVVALLDISCIILAQYYYDAFGNIQEQSGTAQNPIRYAGYQYDKETGLYYLNARYYDSKIARFISEDTYRGDASDPLSLNLYTYCFNNPIRYWDPTGHEAANVTIFGHNIGNAQLNNGVTTGNLRDMVGAFGGSVYYDNAARMSFVNINGHQRVYDLNTMTDSDGNSFTIIDGRIQAGVREYARIAGCEDLISYYRDRVNVFTVTIKATNQVESSINEQQENPIPGADIVKITRLSNEKFINISDGDITYYGGNQDWFPTYTQQYGGCGTVAAANILAYLVLTNPRLAKLFGHDINNITWADFTKFMEEVYKYVTPMELYNAVNEADVIKLDIIPNLEIPPSLGVGSIYDFAAGVTEYAYSKLGVYLKPVELNYDWGKGSNFDKAVCYIRKGLEKNTPVALLNIQNPVSMTWTDPETNKPKQKTYEYHWVTITGMTENKKSGDVTLEVSTWGGKATLSLTALYNNMNWNDKMCSIGPIYFEQITKRPIQGPPYMERY